MRIALVAPEFVTESYFSGGLANYLHRLSRSLAARGHDVHVIVESPGEDSILEFEGVTVHRVTLSFRAGWARMFIRILPHSGRYWVRFGIRAWRRLELLHRAGPVDIVQVPNLRAAGLFIVALSRVPHLTRLSSLQRTWNEAAGVPRGLDARFTEWLELLQLRLSRHIVAPSRSLAMEAEALLGGRRIEVLRSPAYIETGALDSSVFRERLAGRRYLLFVGRLDRHKGVEVLAAALPVVLREHPGCEVVFAGRDSLNSEGRSTQSAIRESLREFDARVHFLGEMSHDRLYPIIQGARVVVLPSLVDNLPNAMLEAMTLGRPVLGTIGTSFDEVIVDGKSGFLVESGSVPALAARMMEVWEMPDSELQAIGQRAQAEMESFAPSVTVQAAEEAYRRVIGTEKGRRR